MTIRTTTTLPAVLALLFAGLAPTAAAQPRSHTTGLFLNFHVNGVGIGYDFGDLDGEPDQEDEGGGGGVQIGYGVSPLVTLFLGADGAAMETDAGDSYALAHVDAGVQLHFRSGRTAVPYGLIGVSYRQATYDFGTVELDFSGGGVTLGGGLKIFFTPALALDLGLLGTFGRFTDVSAGGISANNAIDIDAGSARFNVGLSLFPTRPRR